MKDHLKEPQQAKFLAITMCFLVLLIDLFPSYALYSAANIGTSNLAIYLGLWQNLGLAVGISNKFYLLLCEKCHSIHQATMLIR